MIAIVAALEAELAAVLDAARASGEVTPHTVAGRRFLQGRLAGHDVLLALSGIGRSRRPPPRRSSPSARMPS